MSISGLSQEWKRIELLCTIMQKSRQGSELDAAQLSALSAMQDAVLARRADGAWSFLKLNGLSQLALDLLATVAAPEVSYVAAFAYAGFGGEAQSHEPNLKLVQALLSLQPENVEELNAELHPGGPLISHGLIALDRRPGGIHLKCGRRLKSLLFGREWREPPPGAVEVLRKAGWNDLVAAPEVAASLTEYLALIRHRQTVEGRWGGAKRGGPVGLFSGASGTGKTLAALVIAGELDWPIYRVDLGQLVSKYIGETEKNLNALFDSVTGTDAILLFDESDALFGKRGEVKDARDRYANMEVSHLLARIENHFGPCILTTNLRASIDPAFLRRFHIIADFPFPDADDRLKLWRRHLPPRAPLAADLDLALAAQSIRMTGAAIENAALHAAYAAAAEGHPVGMAHLARGVWNELSKEGARRAAADLGPLAQYLVQKEHDEDRPLDTQVAA